MREKYYKENQDTGELIEVNAVELYPGDYVRRKSQVDYYTQQNKMKSDKTSFVWFLFTYGELIFPNISNANLTRLMYAATFCDYNNLIMGKAL